MQGFRGHQLKGSIRKKNNCFSGIAQNAESYKTQKVGNSNLSVSDPFSITWLFSSLVLQYGFSSPAGNWRGGWKESEVTAYWKACAPCLVLAHFLQVPHTTATIGSGREDSDLSTATGGNSTALSYRLTSLSAVLNPAAQAPINEMSPFFLYLFLRLFLLPFCNDLTWSYWFLSSGDCSNDKIR